ncbi:MAG: hypothetical protein JO235_05225 [Chroococcidiopsidaceae cyanobacterium CP_BM_RX_35]|nr:hypothetical protein [Chroococcidiopsidaceae cyanobacterium CP_BM_RX_35]
MTDQLRMRKGIVQSKLQVILEGEVECDEAYVIAGHKGQPDAVKKKDALGDGVGSKLKPEGGH